MSGSRKSPKTEAVTDPSGSGGTSSPVEVGIRLGQHRMPRELVSTFKVGGIVDLERPVGDCVELYSEGCVIARGEAVVVDGKLGIRVKEILADSLESNLAALSRRKGKKRNS
jgi:flagellar motor switch protein FliN/FliY